MKSGMILFDAHTHIYDCFDLDLFFAAAFENFDRRAAIHSNGECRTCFLLLTEARGLHFFCQLRGMSASEDREKRLWSISRTEEKHSLWIEHRAYPDMRVAVVAGRQLITLEGLELLALFTDGEFADGMELEHAAILIAEQGGVAVCPWGAGKWLGRRGRILRDLRRQGRKEQFFLGDSGGRPSIWSRPRLLAQASITSKIISGSDPLPLAGEEVRAGSFGGSLAGQCSSATPAESLRGKLLDPAVEVTGYGRQLPTLTFIRSQLALRFRRMGFKTT